MKSFKRIISIMLCVTMILGSTLTSVASSDLGLGNEQGRQEGVQLEDNSTEEVEESTCMEEEPEEEAVEETDDALDVNEVSEEELEVEEESVETTEETYDETVKDETSKVEVESEETLVEESVEDETAEESEDVTEETVEETVAEELTEENKLYAGATERTISSGWNVMEGNYYWDGPVADIISIEFRESNEDFTHEDMYYTWEKNGIKYYLYEIWETEDHSYTSSGFGAVIQVPEGVKLKAAKDASYLFAGIGKLKTITNIEMLDTSNTTNFSYMFENCNELEELDLSSFDTRKAYTMEGMFNGCSSLKSLDISSFVTKNVRSMKSMFKNVSSLETIDVSNFDTSNVVKMEYMFATGERTYDENFEYNEVPSKFTEIIFGDNFKTDNVNNMSGMFYGAAVKSLDLTHFNTSDVTDMSEMFDNCAFLEEVDLSSFDTSRVKNFCAMFGDCYRLKSLDVSHFDTTSATSYRYMFANCYGLEEIDVSNFTGQKVDDLCNMFSMSGEATTFVYDDTGYYAIGKTQMDSKLKVVDISGIELDVDGVYAYDMFKGARNLTTIYASPKFVNRGRLMNYDLFRDCDSLVGGNGTAFDDEHIWSDYAVVDTEETPGYFTDKNGITVTVSFVSEYGEAPEDQIIEYGATATKPEKLSDEDYIFEYWYLNDENVEFDFSKGIKSSITLTAKWRERPTWTVTFKNEKTESEITKTVKDGKTVEEIEASKIKGFEFKYWYLEGGNEEAFDFETLVTEDIVLLAKYEIANYTITYNLNGGKFIDGFTAKDKITMNETYELPAADKLTKEEANFLGWYDNKDYSGDPITSIENIENDITLYVKWEDFCIITFNPGPSRIDDDYILYGGESYNVRVKVGDKITVPEITTKAFLYYDYLGYCKYLGGQPKSSRDYNPQIYYEAYNEKGIYLGMFYGGEELEIKDKKINFKSYWWIYGGSQITYEEILQQYGEPTKDCALARQRYNEKKALEEASKSMGSGRSGGGGSGGGGGGGGGGSKGAASLPANNELQKAAAPNAAPVAEAPNAVKSQSEAKTASNDAYSYSSDVATWEQNADGTWSMSVTAEKGQVKATNGFFNLIDTNALTGQQTNAVYYFDENGQMATGWVKDTTGHLYYFETANTADVGKMTTGWKEINGGYYYFGADGKMLTNGVTPDGYVVGADGVWNK